MSSARTSSSGGLLQAVGESGKPVLLQRGMTATIEEWLMAAEYIAQRGNLDVHPYPEVALCDGPQALLGADLRALAQAVRQLPPAAASCRPRSAGSTRAPWPGRGEAAPGRGNVPAVR